MQTFLARLNAGQQLVFPKLARFCLGSLWKPEQIDDSTCPNTVIDDIDQYKMVLLDGYTGTGKTYLVNRLVEYISLVEPSFKVAMTAPTNKAVGELKKHSECQVPLTFCTLHSFLGLKEITDKWTGKKSFGPDLYSGIKDSSSVKLLILDETSQLQKGLFKYLEVHVASGLKILFMGDDKQIPPVGEVQSIPFLPNMQRKYNIYKLSLTKIERQADGNPIIDYAEAIRTQFEKRDVVFDFTGKDKGNTGIQLLACNMPDLIPVLKQYFCTPQFKESSDYIKVICWRNSTAKYFNTTIRKLVHQEEKPPKILKGEKMITTSPVFTWAMGKWDILYTTNEELEVVALTLSTVSISYKLPDLDGLFVTARRSFKSYLLTTISPSKNRTTKQAISVIHEDNELAYNQFVQNFAELANKEQNPITRGRLWGEFYNCQKQFASVDYDYCLTAHKAQGSSYDFAIVHEWDIDVSPDLKERNRIRYVAATRPRHKLFIVK